jgi:hypothetical protein
MAQYKYAQFLTQSNHGAYDSLHAPGHLAPFGGIYRCEGCGHEATVPAIHALPPQNHHVHANPRIPIQWRLVVAHGAIGD